MVFIKDLELKPNRKNPLVASTNNQEEEEGNEDLKDAKVEGTGSGFLWDKFGHIVRNLNFSFEFLKLELYKNPLIYRPSSTILSLIVPFNSCVFFIKVNFHQLQWGFCQI